MLWAAVTVAILCIGVGIYLLLRMNKEENKRPFIISVCIFFLAALFLVSYALLTYFFASSSRNQPPDDSTESSSFSETYQESGTIESEVITSALSTLLDGDKESEALISSSKPQNESTKKAESASSSASSTKPYFHPDPLGFTKRRYEKNPVLKNRNDFSLFLLNQFISGSFDMTFYIPRDQIWAPVIIDEAQDLTRAYFLYGAFKIYNCNAEDLGDSRGVTARFTLKRYHAEEDKKAYAVAQDYIKKHPVPKGGFKTFSEEKEYMRGIHDFVVTITEYDPMGFDPHTLLQTDIYDAKQEAYNSLIEKSAVCAGYAKAVALIAQSAGIDCAWVWGNESEESSHAWNVVFPCDGSAPVTVDATWDDTQSTGSLKPEYTYFYIPVAKDAHHSIDEKMWSFLKYLHS